jgi:6-phosphogluconolactonase (cycloisomerase 2 family)
MRRLVLVLVLVLALLATAQAASAAGNLYYAEHYTSTTISVIDTNSNTYQQEVTAGTPKWMAVNPAGTKMYLGDYADKKIYVMSPGTNTIMATIDTLGQNPTGLAITPDGKWLFVGTWSNKVLYYDLTKGQGEYTGTITVGTAGEGIWGLCMRPDGAELYAAGYNHNNTYAISVATKTVTNTIAVGATCLDIAAQDSNVKVAVLTQNWTKMIVKIIDTGTHAVTATYVVGVGWANNNIEFDNTGLNIYVACNDGVYVNDGTSYASVRKIVTPSSAITLSFANNNNLYIGQQYGNVTIWNTGTNAYIANMSLPGGDIEHSICVQVSDNLQDTSTTTPHAVTFTLRNQVSGKLISDAYVSVKDSTGVILYTAVTDSTGSATFNLWSIQQYTVEFDPPNADNFTYVVYPSQYEYPIDVLPTSWWNPFSWFETQGDTNDTDYSTGNPEHDIWTFISYESPLITKLNGTTGELYVWYSDNTYTTSSLTIDVYKRNQGTSASFPNGWTKVNTTTLTPTSYGNGAFYAFRLANAAGNDYLVDVTAETGAYDTITRDLFVHFKGVMVDLGCPSSWYVWISVILLVAVLGLTTQITVPIVGIVDCLLGYVLTYIGWFSPLGDLATGLAITVALVLCIIVLANGKEGGLI